MKLALLQRIPFESPVRLHNEGQAKPAALHLRSSFIDLTSGLTHPGDSHAGQGPRTCRQPLRSKSGILHVLLHNPNHLCLSFLTSETRMTVATKVCQHR